MPETELPRVSLVVPVRNEEAHISACLLSVAKQDYPRERLEVFVVDGNSTDETLDIIQRQALSDGRIRCLANPDRDLPHGLNIGLAAATGDYVGYVHGRSVLPRDYVRRCIELLSQTGAWSVGGRIVRVGTRPLHRAIALATGSPIGVGDARHNYGSRAGWAETVFPGFWKRSVFDTVGDFDPEMVSNEDNELSLRIRVAGGRIWYDPSLKIQYVPRSDLPGLLHQYRRYALGKTRVLQKHGRGAVRLRHLIPFSWLAFVILGGVVSLLIPTATAVWVGGILIYVVVVLIASARLGRSGTPWWLIAGAIVTIHVGYALGTLQGLAGLVARR